MQEYRNLQKEILQFKGDLQGVKVPVPNEGLDINSMEDVSRDIDFYTVSANYNSISFARLRTKQCKCRM